MKRFHYPASDDEFDDACDLDTLLHPAQASKHPSEVVNDHDLTLNEKRAILASWASDACATRTARSRTTVAPPHSALRARQFEDGRFNRFLAILPPHDFALLATHLRTMRLERGVMLHDVGEEIEHVYFPHTGMVSLVAVMQNGTTVETATIGRGGVIGASAGLGAKSTFGRAVVQLPGTAAWISASQFHAAANQSQAIRDLVVHYNGLLLAQVQQAVACNALHALEARLSRWLLQTHDCIDGDGIPLTQEVLGQMLGVRRTTVTMAAQLLQRAGLIRYRRGLIQIVDRPALEGIACECYAVVRHNVDKIFRGPSPFR